MPEKNYKFPTFHKKVLTGVPISSSMSFNDDESSEIDELLPFEQVKMFYTHTEDKEFDEFSHAEN